MLEVEFTHILGGFTLDIAFSSGGGVTALFGRSGAGKTSVVHAIAGLLRPRRGRIAINGAVLVDTENRIFVPAHKRRIGYVSQEGRLFPHLTVRQNLLFGSWFAARATNAASRARFDDVTALLGIDHLLARRPRRLSGGEIQRVAIGRALLAAPRLLLMDEPLASLDATRKDEILPYLERLRDHGRIPIVYVSHAATEVARLATTIVLIADGFDAGAVLVARIVAHDPRWDLSELEGGFGRLVVGRIDLPVGSQLRVRILARDVIIAGERPASVSSLNVLTATVEKLVAVGAEAVEVELRAGTDRLLARITRRSQQTLGLVPGRRVFALIKAIAVERRSLGHDATTDFAADAQIFEG